MNRSTLAAGALTAAAAAATCYLCNPPGKQKNEKTERPLRVVIAGGGIGGLCTALKLHQAGLDVTVYEMYSEIRSDLGLGINLLPHCTQVLHDLGLAPALQATAIQTGKMILGTNRGMTVWEEPRGVAAGHSTPQYSIHRGKLAKLLEAAVLKELGPDRLKLGHTFVGRVDSAEGCACNLFGHCLPPSFFLFICRSSDALRITDSVECTFETKSGECVTVLADALIGCDGVRSQVTTQ